MVEHISSGKVMRRAYDGDDDNNNGVSSSLLSLSCLDLGYVDWQPALHACICITRARCVDLAMRGCTQVTRSGDPRRRLAKWEPGLTVILHSAKLCYNDQWPDIV
jgi:hypothetical protein